MFPAQKKMRVPRKATPFPKVKESMNAVDSVVTLYRHGHT